MSKSKGEAEAFLKKMEEIQDFVVNEINKGSPGEQIVQDVVTRWGIEAKELAELLVKAGGETRKEKGKIAEKTKEIAEFVVSALRRGKPEEEIVRSVIGREIEERDARAIVEEGKKSLAEVTKHPEPVTCEKCGKLPDRFDLFCHWCGEPIPALKEIGTITAEQVVKSPRPPPFDKPVNAKSCDGVAATGDISRFAEGSLSVHVYGLSFVSPTSSYTIPYTEVENLEVKEVKGFLSKPKYFLVVRRRTQDGTISYTLFPEALGEKGWMIAYVFHYHIEGFIALNAQRRLLNLANLTPPVVRTLSPEQLNQRIDERLALEGVSRGELYSEVEKKFLRFRSLAEVKFNQISENHR